MDGEPVYASLFLKYTPPTDETSEIAQVESLQLVFDSNGNGELDDEDVVLANLTMSQYPVR